MPWVQLLEAAGFSLGLGTRLNIHAASFPGRAQLPSLPYCKRRKAGRGLGRGENLFSQPPNEV